MDRAVAVLGMLVTHFSHFPSFILKWTLFQISRISSNQRKSISYNLRNTLTQLLTSNVTDDFIYYTQSNLTAVLLKSYE